MNTWWRLVVIMLLVTALGRLMSPDSPMPQRVTAPTVTMVTTAPPQVVLPGSQLSSRAPVRAMAIPPSLPTRLDIGGKYPIHAAILPYDGSVLEPPGGDYRDAFIWTRRGLPGDKATDTTYIFGHTFSGPTEGVFDSLQDEPSGTHLQLTTSGTLDYCKVGETYRIPWSKLATDPRVWVVAPPAERGQYVVLIACLLSSDGQLQTGNNVVVVFRRC